MTPLAHWDDVEIEDLDRGRLQALGSAAGSRAAHLDRVRIAAHGEVAPPQGHRREEFHFVLAGSGTLAGAEVGAGQTMLYRPDEEVEALVAGKDGIDVLMFSVDAGETPPAHHGPRPPRAIALKDVLEEPEEHGYHDFLERDLGVALGSHRAGLRHVTIHAAREGIPPHCHAAEEELFIVLSGTGSLFLDDEEHAVRAGSVVSRPPGTGVSHSFVSDADASLTYLAYGERRTDEIVFYRRTGVVAIEGIGRRFVTEPLGDYWEYATT